MPSGRHALHERERHVDQPCRALGSSKLFQQQLYGEPSMLLELLADRR
jgi:hypothetical protein